MEVQNVISGSPIAVNKLTSLKYVRQTEARRGPRRANGRDNGREVHFRTFPPVFLVRSGGRGFALVFPPAPACGVSSGLGSAQPTKESHQ